MYLEKMQMSKNVKTNKKSSLERENPKPKKNVVRKGSPSKKEDSHIIIRKEPIKINDLKNKNSEPIKIKDLKNKNPEPIKIKDLKNKISPSKKESKVAKANIGFTFYKDSKLNFLKDENPYSKKFIFGTKKRSSPKPSMTSSSDKSKLIEIIANNVASSLQEPYCAVCQILLDPASRSKLGETPTKSLEKVPEQSTVWLPQSTTNASSNVSQLLVCRRCKLCVHKDCYNPGETNTDSWTCDGCSVNDGFNSCKICHQPGGPLRMTDQEPGAGTHELVHITCAILIPEITLNILMMPDLKLSVLKRSTGECIICGQTGRPVVHCQAKKECSLAFHTNCAILHQVDIVIGPDSHQPSIIPRCSFCVEKYNLASSKQQDKYPENDLTVGDSVTVTRQDGEKSLGLVMIELTTILCTIILNTLQYTPMLWMFFTPRITTKSSSTSPGCPRKKCPLV